MKLLFSTLLFTVFSLTANASLEKVKINGYEVEYQIAGEGKHTILLEAGGSAGLEDWEPIYNKLTTKAKVIRYSRVGNGNSFKLKKNYSAAEYAREASQLLQALKINEPVVLIAHSYGANIASVHP